MARPRKPGSVHRLQVTLCLWEGEDDDLIAYLVHGDVPPGQRAQCPRVPRPIRCWSWFTRSARPIAAMPGS